MIRNVFGSGAQVPSGPLQHWGSWPGESLDTHKDPHRIPHRILRPLVSGTQLLLQSNRSGPETALIKEGDNPAWSGAQVPSGSLQQWSSLCAEFLDTPKVLTGPSWDLKTSDEWNTTPARRQFRTTDIWTPAMQEESLPAESTLTTETKDRASLPDLLIEAKIITWGTSSNQRQL